MSVLTKIPKSITFLLGMTILTGVLYPAAVTLVAQLAFPGKANGSLLVMKGAVRGSKLLAQKFPIAAILPSAAVGQRLCLHRSGGIQPRPCELRFGAGGSRSAHGVARELRGAAER